MKLTYSTEFVHVGEPFVATVIETQCVVMVMLRFNFVLVVLRIEPPDPDSTGGFGIEFVVNL